MRIDHYGSTGTESIKQFESPNVERVALQKGKLDGQKTTTEDTTTLSSTSNALHRLTELALGTVPSRAAKVAALKYAVDNARYQPDSGKIAEALSSAGI